MNESPEIKKAKKPLYKKWWFWAIIVVIVFIAIPTGSDEKADTESEVTQTVEETAKTVEANSDVAEQKQTVEVATEEDSMTMGQKNALKKAKLYLETMAFSHDSLVKQLEYEGYSNEEAVYGADNCDADWNEQAAAKAKMYLETMAFSRDGLIEQLEFEGFTHEQATYGAEENGY